ncbi:hypothetical protein KCP74_15345 [Salmonella enterica subsp. enterica]|nr:hypothetical protein KCP74_15345 [Salmonella enterica subsp. enterica]
MSAFPTVGAIRFASNGRAHHKKRPRPQLPGTCPSVIISPECSLQRSRFPCSVIVPEMTALSHAVSHRQYSAFPAEDPASRRALIDAASSPTRGRTYRTHCVEKIIEQIPKAVRNFPQRLHTKRHNVQIHQ